MSDPGHKYISKQAQRRYKKHFACFSCRKVFKRTLWNKDSNHPGYTGSDLHLVPCPQCGASMVNMGRDFKAPKQNDLDQWATVELLYRHGITYGPRPTKLRDAVNFLGGNLASTEGKFILRRIARNDKRHQRKSSA